VNGFIMDHQLTLTALLRRAATLYGDTEIVTRLADKRSHHSTYADLARRAQQLAVALRELEVRPGDRVATLCWNHHQHLEAYFGVPACGAILHTLNPRLHPDDLTYIVNHAGDRVLLVDQALWPVFEQFHDRVSLGHVVMITDDGVDEQVPEGTLAYERLLAAADGSAYVELDLDERTAAAMCYTSGTTGRPKGVLYSHRALVLHAMAEAMTDVLGLSESDVVLPAVAMFHVNAWGLPYACTLVGAKQVLPGRHLDPASLLEALQSERVTVAAGIPTIWLGLLRALDGDPAAYDLSRLRLIPVGGAAAPKSMIAGFQERHGLKVLHAWGMTEMSSAGTVSFLPGALQGAAQDVRYAARARQGTPMPLVELRARGAEGFVPWDGAAMGELEVRGPCVASAYYDAPEAADRWTEDGWFRTGDIVTIDARGNIEIQDRTKDLIRSGGEWISSVALENALMGHPAVAEAAVIGIPDAKWQERPLAVVVLRPGQTVSGSALHAFLEPQFARWWLPDAFEVVDAIPRTAVGKFLKSALRERFRDYAVAEQVL
jgi:fatty-acyl-CoA synthase